MDVFLENASIRNIAYALPESSSYFLCDQNGALLYADTALEADGEKLQEYLDFLLAGIEMARCSHTTPLSRIWTVWRAAPIFGG